MSMNIYTGKLKNKLKFSQRILLVCVPAIVAFTIFSISSCIPQKTKREDATKINSFSENIIKESGNAVLNFETLWLSEQAYKNPSIQEDLATGKYLEYWRLSRHNIENEPLWLVTDSAELESIQLIEYRNDHFKAKACIVKIMKEIRPDGSLIKTLSRPPYSLCGIYVFTKTKEKWKLLGYIETMDPRTYEHAPDWLKEIVGDIPQE